MTASAASNQVGAAVGAHAFATIGPAGVVAVRQFVAAAVLLPVGAAATCAGSRGRSGGRRCCSVWCSRR